MSHAAEQFPPGLEALDEAAGARFAAVAAGIGLPEARILHDLAVTAVAVAQPQLEAEAVELAVSGRLSLDEARARFASRLYGVYLGALAKLAPWSLQ